MRRLGFLVCGLATTGALLAFACGGSVPGVAPILDEEDATDARALPTDAATSFDADAACPFPPTKVMQPARPLRILFVTKETLFVHAEAHQVGDVAVPAYLRNRGHEVTVTNDSSFFTPEKLAPFDVVVLFVTSGQVITEPAARDAFMGFVHAGKGVVGVHTATATDNEWLFIHDLLGVTFKGHGTGDAQVTPGRAIVDDPTSPLTSFLPNPWERTDEWYYYDRNPALNPELRSLLSLDESSLQAYRPSYPDEGFYGDAGHPLAWTHEYACGRTFYTSFGHTGASFQEEPFLRFLAVGTEWAGAQFASTP